MGETCKSYEAWAVAVGAISTALALAFVILSMIDAALATAGKPRRSVGGGSCSRGHCRAAWSAALPRKEQAENSRKVFLCWGVGLRLNAGNVGKQLNA